MTSKVVNPLPGDGNTKNEFESMEGVAQKNVNVESGINESEVKQKHNEELNSAIKKEKYPTLIVDLPSKGLLYPEDNPLSLGYVEMKYMTAKEEDILTTESYIKKGVVLDKLFQSLIVSKIDYNSMLIGDRDAIMIAARIYGYGEEYVTTVTTPSGNKQQVTINLHDIPHKKVDFDLFVNRENKFFFKTLDGTELEFKLLTNGDQYEIQNNLRKIKHGDARDTQLTSRLFQMIQAVNGNRDRRLIKTFIENDFRAIDSRRFREYVASIQPGIDLSIEVIDEETGEPFRTTITFGLDFFWTNV